jgi:hypothetical protein
MSFRRRLVCSALIMLYAISFSLSSVHAESLPQESIKVLLDGKELYME